MRCPAAVKALSMAVLMEVIFAPSMRAKARRWHDASTMAMFIGTPISSARFSAAARARRAPVRVRVGVVFVDMFDVLVNVQRRGKWIGWARRQGDWCCWLLWRVRKFSMRSVGVGSAVYGDVEMERHVVCLGRIFKGLGLMT